MVSWRGEGGATPGGAEESKGRDDEGGRTRQDQGYGLRHWRAGGMTYWAVSDVNPADLALFEADLKARTGG